MPKHKPKTRKIVVVENKIKQKSKQQRNATRVARGPQGGGVLSNLGAAGGAFLGNLVVPGAGGIIGGAIGRAAGSVLGKITGMGSYQVKVNSLMNPGVAVPEFASVQPGCIRLCHSEFISDVMSATDFTNIAYNVNPGIASTFPYLSQLAASFQEYEFRGLVFAYKSMSANSIASTNTALGTMICASNYNALQADYASKQEMEASDYCTSAPPSLTMLHPIECDPKMNVLKTMYIRDGTEDEDDDIRMADLCKFQMGAVGAQEPSVAGELWVSYDVVLKKPRLNPSFPDPLTFSRAARGLSTPAGSATASKVFGTVGTTWYGDVSVSNYSDTAFILPDVGLYLIVLYLHSPTHITAGGVMGVGSNCTTPDLLADDNDARIYTADTEGDTSDLISLMTVSVNVQSNTSANQIETCAGSSFTGYASGDTTIFVCRLPAGLIELAKSSKSIARNVTNRFVDKLKPQINSVSRFRARSICNVKTPAQITPNLPR